MSATAATWVVLFGVLLVMSMRRPVWAVSLYMLTFFAAPHLWWWGDEIPNLRYALWTGVVLLASVTLHASQQLARKYTVVDGAAIALIVNSSFVHATLSVNSSVSLDTYVEVLKYVLLYFMLGRAIQDKADFRVLLMTCALGAGYIGYEVTINERGDFNGARLEGVGAPAADSSNGLAGLMLLVLPLAGSLFIGGTKTERLTAIVTAPLILNVILMCNSRGAFLGLIGGGLTFLLLARGPTRKKALKTLALGSVALYLLLGNPKILDRFQTTFVGSEERDNSASSRITFWKAGLGMLNDYPLGAGGGSFKYVLAEKYLRDAGSDEAARSLHNGYLTEATDWGVQGLFLKLLFIGAAIVAAYRAANRSRLAGQPDDSLMGLCVLVATVGFLITCIFGSFLNHEWSYWIVAMMVRYSEIYGLPQTTSAEAPEAVHYRTATVHPASAALRPSAP